MAKRKKQASSLKKNKRQSNLSRVLASSKEPKGIRWAYLNQLSLGEIRSNISNVASHPFFVPIVNLTTIKNYKGIYTDANPFTDLAKSVNWAIGLLIYHKSLLVKFIKLEEELTTAILDQRYDDAIACINQIDDLCGISSWSIANRGSVLKLGDKFSKAQDFLDSIYDGANYSDFFKLISRNIINRYDDSSMFISSSNALRKQILRNIQGDLQSFLIYKIIPQDFSAKYRIDYQAILNYEKNSSIIDIFKAIIGFVSNKHNEEEQLMRLTLQKLSTHISYPILDGLAVYHGITPNWIHRKKDYKLIDLYSAGKYEEVCAHANLLVEDHFSLFELVAKSSARAGVNPFGGLKGFLLSNLVEVFLKKSDYQKSLSNLLSICHAFSGIPWFQELHFLVSRESGFMDEESLLHLSKLSSAYSNIDSPQKASTLPWDLRDDYFASCHRAVKKSITIKLFEYMETEVFSGDELLDKVESNRLLKYNAKKTIKFGEIEEAIPVLEKLVQCSDTIIAFDAMKLLVDAYIDTGQETKAVELFTDAVLRNSNVVMIFNIHRLFCVAQDLIKDSCSISVPIALSLYSRYVDDSSNSTLRYSFEKYLDNTGMKTPLDIIARVDEIGEDKVNYFLEYVCTQDVMKLYLLFDNKVEIENCRVEICNYLIESNISKNIMVNEVKQITRNQVIRRAVSQVDQSRIFADTSGFKDRRSSEFRTVFERYLELKKQDFSDCSDEIEMDKIYKILSEKNLLDEAYTVHLLNVSINEKNLIFHKLISMLRDEFTFGDKGLNSYLSTRIRHGVLPNQIRSCASNEQLVTAIQAHNGLPKSNTYWKKELSSLPEFEITHIEKALNSFTIEFEEIIAEINDRWLQIVSLDQDIKNLQKGGAKDKALFDYSISTLETYSLQKCLIDNDYDNFVRIVSDWLWRRTELNLEKVKEQILGSANDKFASCYATLLASINTVGINKRQLIGLQDAIGRSKDSLNTSLNIISSWFTRSEMDSIREFEIATAIEIARRSANIKINKVDIKDGCLLDGKYLTSFVDVFYILFENAVTKSMVAKEMLEINVCVEMTVDKKIIIVVANNCKIRGSIEAENKKLDYYREAYGNEELIRNVVQQEGGTGLFKIWRILSKDIEVEHETVFGYEDSNQFMMKIIMLNNKGIVFDENLAG